QSFYFPIRGKIYQAFFKIRPDIEVLFRNAGSAFGTFFVRSMWLPSPPAFPAVPFSMWSTANPILFPIVF
ncbi:hypothetical protein BACCOPRO_03849, partial [Phocaeicola coprophilus DSM 18228 = JCM 13818]